MLVGVLTALTCVLVNGVTIDTRDATNLSDSEKSNLLKKYNSISGGIASVVAKAFQPLVGMLVAVAFLCGASAAVMSDEKSFPVKMGPILVSVVVSTLIGQGLSALNVQFNLLKVDYVISAKDLIKSDVEFSFNLSVTNVTSTVHLQGIASTDTILRAAIRPLTPNYTTSCQVEGGILNEEPEASVRFGFPLTSWLQNMLPESIASDESFSFTMTDTFPSGKINVSMLPGENLNKTAELYSYTLWSAFNRRV